MKKTVLICVMAFLGFVLNAQDIHFSQFYNAPTYINPALTGVFEGNLRAIANYRNQWGSITPNPFETSAFYVDGTPYAEKIENGFMGLGLGVYSDKAGDGKLGITQINGTLSYSHHLSNNQSLGVGVQVGHGMVNIDYQNLTWDNMWNGTSVDPTLGSGETMLDEEYSYLDVSSGVLWYFYPNEVINVKLGASMYHINKSYYHFHQDIKDQLHPKIVVHTGVDYAITKDKFYILPRAVYVRSASKQHELLLGGFASYVLATTDNMPTINGGLWYRAGDALILAAEVWYGNFRLGLSYDINVSGLSAASQSQGGPEISLTSIFPLPSKVRYKKIPCPINF